MFVAAVLAQATLMIVFTAAPASAATIDSEHPGSSCTGDHDVLHWDPQNVPGLLGYQVEQWVQHLDIETPYQVTQVGPDVTSLPFVVQPGNGIGNLLFIKTITADGVSGTFDGATATSRVPPGGVWMQFKPSASSTGDHQATIVFGRNPMDKFTDFATSVAITPTPAGGQATILDGIGFTTRFDGLRNGTPYRFTAVGSNACGTGTASSQSDPSVVPGFIHITSPAALPAATVGVPYIEMMRGTGGCTDPTLCNAVVHRQWSVTSGATPPGTTLLGTGQLTGVPTTAGSYTFTATASAACNCVSDRPTKTFTVVVDPAGDPAIASSANPAVSGQPVTFTVTMPGAATVSLFDGATLLATKAAAYGKATFHTKLTAGSHAISAKFTPKGAFLQWLVPGITQQVDPAATVTTLTAKPLTQTHSKTVTFAATVKRLAPSTGKVVAGTVSFYDDTTLLATLPVVNGSVAFKTNTLATGTHPITATYNGASENQTSSSAVVDEAIV